MPDMHDALTVGEISRLTGVTIRTLHHYDEIGLVSPAERSGSGYRLYGPAEVRRLQEVLFFRELGMALDEIGRIVDDPGYRRDAALRRHRRMIEAKADHLLRMLDAIDSALTAERTGHTMTNDELLGVFGDFDPSEFQQEAAERWGDTDAFGESARRTARYSRADWEQMRREAGEIDAGLVALMEAGAPADGPAAMDLAERHREHISAWFYECTADIHRALGEMYVADARFTENIDRAAPGLAAYLSAAIAANSRRSPSRSSPAAR